MYADEPVGENCIRAASRHSFCLWLDFWDFVDSGMPPASL